jgi:hypothetical protein
MQTVKVGRRVAIMLLLSLTLVAAKCSDPQATGVSKALQATDTLRASIDAAITLTTKLAQDNHISPAQEKQINLLLLGVNSSVKIFYLEVLSARDAGEWNPTVKGKLAATFANVNSELQMLNRAGVFDVNNPEEKKKLDLVLKSINSAAQLINATLQ